MNSFGTHFRISIFGESHGKAIGVVVDGCPAGIPISKEDFIADILKRKSGKKATSERNEDDELKIISGLYNGYSSGSPICLMFENLNVKSEDYLKFIKIARPGHADFVAQQKWKGFQDGRGGGHFSGRLTLPLVAAGVIAKKIVNTIEINAKIVEIGGEKDVEMAIEKAILNNDSIGGIIECVASNMPVGIGEPFFNSIESMISHLIFSIPAIKGIEFGNGFESAKLTGKDNNDAFSSKEGKTITNNAGGINGGISNGNNLIFRVAVKPTSSTPHSQHTFNFETNQMDELTVEGRHDLCIALRMPVIVEAITAIAFADLFMANRLSNFRI